MDKKYVFVGSKDSYSREEAIKEFVDFGINNPESYDGEKTLHLFLHEGGFWSVVKDSELWDWPHGEYIKQLNR